MDRDNLDLDSYPKVPTFTLVLDGQTRVIGPFRGRQLAAAMRLSRPLLQYFAAFQDTGEQRIDFALLIDKHFEPLCELCDLVLGWEEGSCAGGKLAPDQQVDLLRGIIRVNLDFFFHRMQPSLDRLVQDVAAIRSDSAKPGSGSSPAVTPPRWSWLTPWRKSGGGSPR